MLRRIRLRTITQSRHLSTLTGARAKTIYSPTPELLESYLNSNSPSPSSSSLYLLSTSLPASTLSPLLSILQSIPSSIGSFAISPPGPTVEPTLSIANIPKSRTFRTDLSGRTAKQVGRFQRIGTVPDEGDSKGSEIGESEDIQREEGWAGMWKGEGSSGAVRVPELEDSRYSRAKSFLLLTDGNPRPVLHGLEAMFPGTSKIGLLSAPTPFLTGRPHTLLHNKEVFESGTVGIALENELEVEVEFGVRALTPELTIAGAQGNMLLRLKEGSGNPTQTLMNAIQRRDSGAFTNRDEEFFLKLGGADEGGRMIKILSGDPSRGALSLDMEEPLLEGEKVQFMFREDLNGQGRGVAQPVAGRLTFAALQRSDDADVAGKIGEPRIVDGFLGMSEEGFIHQSAICTVPFATATVKI